MGACPHAPVGWTLRLSGVGVLNSSFGSAPGVAVRIGATRSPVRRVRDRVESFLSAANLSLERTFLFVRPTIALLVIVAVVIADEMPGRQGVIIGCSMALGYNVVLAALVLKRRIYLLRATTIICDHLTIICTSLWVFAKMGQAGYESDLWLVFATFIITSAMSYGPLGSMFFAALWTGMLLFISTGIYDADSYTRDELPMRLTFFVLISFCVISLSAELRNRSDKLGHKSRQTLSMLATIVEARDTDAGLHLRHITHYSRAIALVLGMTETQADEIAYAAMIHDVGKAQVPDSILKKPGPLTLDERREIERHTVWGHELLTGNDEFATACEVARSHHERWDGTGYPDGLAGEAIPLAARITAVADVYDALTNERPYKHAWTTREAIAEIKRLRGSHFDPAVVDAFLRLHESGVLSAIDAGIHEGNGDLRLAA